MKLLDLGIFLLLVLLLRPYTLPPREEPTVVTDRWGTVLRKVPSPGGVRDERLGLDEVPPLLLLSLIASEDAGFFGHAGIDPASVARAAWLDVKSGRAAYGASTISMQLAGLMDPTLQSGRRSAWQKLRQSIDAVRLERALDKRQILEEYVNRACFGHGAIGLEAAARLYFGKPARGLSNGEATLLAVIPRAPTHYDPTRNLVRLLERRGHVLGLLEKRGLISGEARARVEAEPLSPSLHAPPFWAPHFVDFVLGTPRKGVVKTTLDLPLQTALEHRLREHVAGLEAEELSQAGLVVLDTATGEIRALLGSADYQAGQVNIATRLRHPGSALKPFVYASAIELGKSPASVAYDVADVPSRYRPLVLQQRERGPVRYREALAGSYNLAAVHVLEEVGLERVLTRLRTAGLGPLEGDPEDYGLRLALGSATVRLVDLASAYGFLVRGGRVVAAHAVEEMPPSLDRQVFSREASWLTMDMLADPEARRPMFGDELPFDLPFPVAAKTGTARGFADTVAVAVTRELTVAAWAGNFDGRPTRGLHAMDTAAPLVREALLIASQGRALTLPPRPATVVSHPVCALSGKRPGPHCLQLKRDWFVTPPSESCDWHRADGVHLPEELQRWAASR